MRFNTVLGVVWLLLSIAYFIDGELYNGAILCAMGTVYLNLSTHETQIEQLRNKE